MIRRAAALAILLSGLPKLALGQAIITTVAGTDFFYPAGGAPARSVPLAPIGRIAIDPQGNVYATTRSGLVLKISPNGILKPIAGNYFTGFSGDGGPATSASFDSLDSIAVDSNGNVFVADTGNTRVRRISPDGIVTTVAGGGTNGPEIDNIAATDSSIATITALAVDGAGNLYFSDSYNGRVRRVGTDGRIITVVGNGKSGFSGDGGPAIAASIANVRGLALDSSGNLYLADLGNTRVRKVTPAGVISTFAGNGERGFSGDGGPATAATFTSINDVAVDRAGNVYIIDADNDRIRRVGLDGNITTIAGEGQYGIAPDGAVAAQSSLGYISSLAVDASGNVNFPNFGRIRRVGTDGVLTSIAGLETPQFSGDGGLATSALLSNAASVTLDAAGNLYILDSDNSRIRKVDSKGIITTIAGNGQFSSTGDGGPASAATLNGAEKILFVNGSLYISQRAGTIRKINSDGIISTFAGGANSGLVQPAGLAADKAGNLYVADPSANRVFRIAADGTVTAVVGSGEHGATGDGGPALKATLDGPVAVAVDASNNLYIADFNNNRVRRVTADGIISTLVGSDINSLTALTFDGSGNLLFLENNQLVQILPSGALVRIASSGNVGFRGDGGPAADALLTSPSDIAVGKDGTIYIADSGNNRVRAILSNSFTFQASPASLNFTIGSPSKLGTSQSITLTSVPPGLPFQVSSSAPWLVFSPSKGVMPAVIQVSLGQPPAGVLRGSLIVTAPNAAVATREIPVTLTPTFGGPPPVKVQVDTASISLSVTQGGQPATGSLQISSTATGVATVNAAVTTDNGGNWLAVTPASLDVSSTIPVHFSVLATPGTLAPGTYSGAIVLTSSDLPAPRRVPVFLVVTQAQPLILLSQTGLTFTAVAGAGKPLPQTITLLNAGQGVMNFTAQANTLAGGSWLSVSPASGSLATPLVDTAGLVISVDASNLSAGNYFGAVTVHVPNADNSPQSISIVLNVLQAGSNPGPEVRPTGLVFTGPAGSVPPSQSVMIANLQGQIVSFGSGNAFLDAVDWFGHVPSNAAIGVGSTSQVVIQPDFRKLAAGVQRGVLTLVFSDGSVRTVSTLAVVSPAGGATAGKDGKQADGCTADRLVISADAPSDNFLLSLQQPAAMQLKVLNNCGEAMSNGGIQATFSNGDPPVSMNHLAGGTWSGTWQPRNATNDRIRISITALALKGLNVIAGQLDLSGAILGGTATGPFVASTGIRSAASFTADAPVSPGALISIFGGRMADAAQTAGAVPLGTQLANSQVMLGDRSLPLLYASDGQINAQVPVDLAVNSRQQLTIRHGQTLSVPELVTIAAAQPAVFTVSQQGSGQGIIVNATTNIIADSTNPVHVNDAIVIYATGLGTVTPSVPSGVGAPGISRTIADASVTIGGLPATVLFSGLTPSFPGLYQVNAIIPAGVTPGNAVPVQVTLAGQVSPPVTIGIR